MTLTIHTDALRDAIDRADAHWREGRVDAALACCHEALRIDPTSVDALAHTGTIAWLRDDPAGAERLYLRAHAIAPRHLGVLLNLATLHHENDDLAAALHWLEKADAVRPGHRDVVWLTGLIELANGDYANGWTHYEAGLLHAGIRGRGPGLPSPPWDGTPCDRLLIWHEQGLGDTIQFVRYARLCRARAKRVVVLCPTELVALLASCPDIDAVTDSIGADEFDQHVSIMSLPHRFGTTLETVPDAVPYLFADPARVARWVPRVDDTRLKVGLAWAGNFRVDQPRFHRIDRRRNLPLQTLGPLLAMDGFAFFSLQKGPASREVAGTRVVDRMAEVASFADTAAIVAQLDLVISVDTAVAHLAGAMGKPVWILSRRDACWRWLRNRADSPWYPTARVFGQRTADDWHPVIAAVREALAALAR